MRAISRGETEALEGFALVTYPDLATFNYILGANRMVLIDVFTLDTLECSPKER